MKGEAKVIGGRTEILSQSLAITLIVIIIGATFYLWRMRMLRGRAALLTIAAVIAVLAYIAVTQPTMSAITS